MINFTLMEEHEIRHHKNNLKFWSNLKHYFTYFCDKYKFLINYIPSVWYTSSQARLFFFNWFKKKKKRQIIIRIFVISVSDWICLMRFYRWNDRVTYTYVWYFISCKRNEKSEKAKILFAIAVIAGSEGVPDALQKCHSLSRDLQNNQTIIFTHLSDFKLQINNFTTQVKFTVF